MNEIKEIENLMKLNPRSKSYKSLAVLKEHLMLLEKYMEIDGAPYSSSGNIVEKYYSHSERVLTQFSMVMQVYLSLLPDLKNSMIIEYGALFKGDYKPRTSGINDFLEHWTDILKIYQKEEEAIEEGNIFLSVEDKMKRAEKSVKEGNPEGLFSNLHTAIEIIIKDKLGIALDMDGAKLGKVMGICMRNKVFNNQESILQSIRSNVCDVDNKIKHSGYNPTGNDINNGLLITKQFLRVIKSEAPKIDDKVKEEINQILIKNN